MPANTSPLFPLTPNISWAAVSATANTAQDGTGTVSTLFTAGSNGAWVDEVIWLPLGTNILTVARMWINNGSATSSAGNNSQIGQITLPATTLSNTTGLFVPRFPVRMALPAGYTITACIATTVATGFQATVLGGDY